jgi:hypothetical protein
MAVPLGPPTTVAVYVTLWPVWAGLVDELTETAVE